MQVSTVLLIAALALVTAFPDARIKRQLPERNEINRKENRHTEEARDGDVKSASSIAQKAAAEAKAAHAAQNAAGAQAAHMVKTQLAEKALQAAKAAEAALAGKQAVVEQLQHEVKEAEAAVAENTAAIQKQQVAVNAAGQAAQQASAQHKLLMQAVQLAAQNEKSSIGVLEKIKNALQEKNLHLSESRSRLAQLEHKLQYARAECAATKQAAQTASEAARAACGNARKKKQVRRSVLDSQEKRVQ